MADLNELSASQTVKIAGSDSTGSETAFISTTLNQSTKQSLDVNVTTVGRNTAAGSIPVVLSENITYSASASGFVPPANATDIFEITGSATKTIRINGIVISATTVSGAPIKITVLGIKRSTVNTEGTRVADIVVPHDSTSPAGTATVGHYTANPTLGTSVGIIRSISSSISSSGIFGSDIFWDFKLQPLILRGTSEQFTVNLNNESINGPIVSIWLEWEEI